MEGFLRHPTSLRVSPWMCVPTVLFSRLNSARVTGLSDLAMGWPHGGHPSIGRGRWIFHRREIASAPSRGTSPGRHSSDLAIGEPADVARRRDVPWARPAPSDAAWTRAIRRRVSPGGDLLIIGLADDIHIAGPYSTSLTPNGKLGNAEGILNASPSAKFEGKSAGLADDIPADQAPHAVPRHEVWCIGHFSTASS
jgi:hypothetical protein